MNTPLIRRPDGNGASAEAVPAAAGAAAGTASADAPLPSGRRISGVFMTCSFLFFVPSAGDDCRAVTFVTSREGAPAAAVPGGGTGRPWLGR